MENTLYKPITQQSCQRPRVGESVCQLMAIWHQRQQQRQALLKMNERLLSDIGISRCDAEQEAAKPFWKA